MCACRLEIGLCAQVSEITAQGSHASILHTAFDSDILSQVLKFRHGGPQILSLHAATAFLPSGTMQVCPHRIERRQHAGIKVLSRCFVTSFVGDDILLLFVVFEL